MTPLIRSQKPRPVPDGYARVLADVSALLEQARRTASRAINTVMTATYWEIGRRIVIEEQRGRRRAGYGEELIHHLAAKLTERFGRGFGVVNLANMRRFYRLWPAQEIFQTLSEKSGQSEAAPPQSEATRRAKAPATAQRPKFPLTWSHYVRLLQVKNDHARRFYETEALRGGWTVRQLDRQVNSQFYERTALSRNKAAMLAKGARRKPEDATTPEEEIKDPFVLEFLDLKDEYSESELEEALIHQLEAFLLELGGDFTFVGRQRRLRVGNAWYRVDLVFFNRALRCLVLADIKTGQFTHADAGQMHLYLNYAREHWTRPGENPPVGLILCANKDAMVAKYALDGLPNKVLAAEYRTLLPDEHTIEDRLMMTRRALTGERQSVKHH